MQELEGPNPSSPYGRWHKAVQKQTKPRSIADREFEHMERTGVLLAALQRARDFAGTATAAFQTANTQLSDILNVTPTPDPAQLVEWARDVATLRGTVGELTRLRDEAQRVLTVAERHLDEHRNAKPMRKEPTPAEAVLGWFRS